MPRSYRPLLSWRCSGPHPPLVAHARKEAVNGEAISGPTLRGPRVGLLVGILVCYAFTGDGLYDLVAGAHPREALCYRRPEVLGKSEALSLPAEPAKTGVKGVGVHEIIPERPRAAAWRKAINLEGEIN